MAIPSLWNVNLSEGGLVTTVYFYEEMKFFICGLDFNCQVVLNRRNNELGSLVVSRREVFYFKF